MNLTSGSKYTSAKMEAVKHKVAEFFLANYWTIGIGASVISVFALLRRLGLFYILRHKV